MILENIENEIKRLGIKTGAVVSGIGSARKIVYHRIASLADDPVNEFITVEGPTEIGAIQGLIIDGEPHLHITCCGREAAFAGHMEHGCQVQYLAEICIVEIKDADLTRRLDEFGISYIDKR
jgi:predicted DNA-binding protein with PD1-like motif